MMELKGRDIKTIRIFYENLSLMDNKGNEYRMSVQEFEKILGTITFIKTKKRVHTWLEIKTI